LHSSTHAVRYFVYQSLDLSVAQPQDILEVFQRQGPLSKLASEMNADAMTPQSL